MILLLHYYTPLEIVQTSFMNIHHTYLVFLRKNSSLPAHRFFVPTSHPSRFFSLPVVVDDFVFGVEAMGAETVEAASKSRWQLSRKFGAKKGIQCKTRVSS